MVRRITGLIGFILLTSYALNAQDTLDFKKVDQATYESYQNKDWNRLLDIGNAAINKGIDYYYLRLRMGIAYYELENYRKAITHFELAKKFNPADPVSLEYLYYSYTFCNLRNEAHSVWLKMSKSLRRKIRPHAPPLLDLIYIEAGPSISNNQKKNEMLDIDGRSNIYGEIERQGDVFYYHASLAHWLLPGIYLTHAYTKTELQKEHIVMENNNIDMRDTFLVEQQEYYISVEIIADKKLKITPAFHLANVSYQNTRSDFDPQNKTITYTKYDTVFNEYLLALAITEEQTFMNYTLAGGISKFNGQRQVKLAFEGLFFPKGNLNLFYGGKISLFRQNNDIKPVFDILGGWRISNYLWAEASFTYGNFSNYHEKNGYLIYNISDKTNYKTGLSFKAILGKHLELSLLYQLTSKENYYHNYEIFRQQRIELAEKSANFTNQNIIGGVKWKF